MEEQWKPIPGYEDTYMVSDQGRIKTLEKKIRRSNGFSVRKEQVIKPIIQRSGYAHVGLWREHECKQSRVHRLVASAFCENDDPEHKTQVNHINEDKLDNRACNLEWTDPKTNTNHNNMPKRRGATLSEYRKHYSGVNCIFDGEIVESFDTIADANAWLGVNRENRNISDCCRGRYNTAFGYGWWYREI